jgi:hypothetical protein
MQQRNIDTSRLVWLFLWQAICAVSSLYMLFITWNGKLLEILCSNGMCVPSAATFKTAMYVFLGGVLGSTLYVSYRIYSHVVYPDNDVLPDDLDEEEKGRGDKQTPAEIRKEDAENRAEEGRRFNARTIFYWYLRPLMGGIAGLISLAFIGTITAPFRTGGCSDAFYSYGASASFAYLGAAFIAGFCFGDFVKFLQAKAKVMFKNQENTSK